MAKHHILEAKEFAKDFIKKNAEHTSEVLDYLQLMIDEIEEGESAENELSLFKNACEQLKD